MSGHTASDLARELRDEYPAVDVTSVVFSGDFAGIGCCVIPQDRVLAVISALDSHAELVKALEASADALREARAWVMKAPEDTWGHNSQGDYDVPGGVSSWPIRDELSHNIGASEIAARAALATLTARKVG